MVLVDVRGCRLDDARGDWRAAVAGGMAPCCGRVRGGRFGVLGCRVLAGWWARAFCLRLRACLLVFGLVSRVLRAMLSVAARVGWFVAAR